MPNAKLIKALEKKGFSLEFPDYDSIEEMIIEILREKNARINLSLPLLLNNGFDYKKIASKLSKEEKKDFDKAILISQKIYRKENLKNSLREMIAENKVRSGFSEAEFKEYYASFRESQLNQSGKEQRIIEKQSKLRLNLDLNKSLRVLFSPAKIRIMEKIFNHKKLTNTELKYYYRSISNINKAVLTPALSDYLRIIEISRKFR